MDVVNSAHGGVEVPALWPSEEAKERYIRFLELELRLMKNASEGTVDPDLLTAFNGLLDESFPRTKAYLEKKLASDVAGSLRDEIRAVAWAEARALPGREGQAKVSGAWTQNQISDDISECFRVARKRAGL